MFSTTQRYILLLVVVAIGVALVFAGNLTGDELWAFLTGAVVGVAGAAIAPTGPPK